MAGRFRILVAEPEDFSELAIQLPRQAARSSVKPVASTTEPAASFSEYNVILLRLKFRVTSDLVPGSPHCRILTVPTTGVDRRRSVRGTMHSYRQLSAGREFLMKIRTTAEHRRIGACPDPKDFTGLPIVDPLAEFAFHTPGGHRRHGELAGRYRRGTVRAVITGGSRDPPCQAKDFSGDRLPSSSRRIGRTYDDAIRSVHPKRRDLCDASAAIARSQTIVADSGDSRCRPPRLTSTLDSSFLLAELLSERPAGADKDIHDQLRLSPRHRHAPLRSWPRTELFPGIKRSRWKIFATIPSCTATCNTSTVTRSCSPYDGRRPEHPS